MTKEIDVSKIDVGWRVQLDATTFNDSCKKLHGVWATVSSLQEYGLYVVDDLEGWNRYIDKDPRNFLAALPPEPAKDPFAVGEWVVCVETHFPYKVGDLAKVCGRHLVDPEHRVMLDGVGVAKSHFRSATPEEIAAHLGQNKEPEPAPDGKITFTVAGREFFVGQRVWTLEHDNLVEFGGMLEVVGVAPCFDTELVMVRRFGEWILSFSDPNRISYMPVHDWKFGDQASHPDHGTVLIIDMTEPEAFQCSSPSDPEIFIDPAELTFIRRTDLGE